MSFPLFKKIGDRLRYGQDLMCDGGLVLESNFLVIIILQYTQRLCGSQAASIWEVICFSGNGNASYRENEHDKKNRNKRSQLHIINKLVVR